MQRPTRIVVFGVLCLVMGGFSLLNNIDQAATALGGPEAVDIPAESEAPGQVGQMMRDVARATRGALSEPVYRIGLGVKSVLGTVMAAVLIAIGGGLLRDRYWALRLARVWAVYAIASALLIVVLQALYVVPAIQAVTQTEGHLPGGEYLGMGFMFMVMCVFPMLLLIVLPKPNVVAYLRGGGEDHRAMPVEDGRGTPSDHAQASGTPPAGPASSPPPSATSTWRGDPWDDSTSH